MEKEMIVSYRPDREIKKKVIVPGDYNLVPYEDSRCNIVLSDVFCVNDAGNCDIDLESRIFCKEFDGNVLIGDSDSFIDKDFELVLQQMCFGEVCTATITYRDSTEKLAKEISCKIKLKDVTEEQLVSDWSWQRLFECATHHKDCGVSLVKEKKVIDGFRQFSKAMKMLVAIEPVNPEMVDEESVKQIINLKIKLYNNLAHCQLQYNEYKAALELCNRTLVLDSNNIKALYRRCLAHTGLNLLEEAWKDIEQVLLLDPDDKTAQHRASLLKPQLDQINKEYKTVIKKMFG